MEQFLNDNFYLIIIIGFVSNVVIIILASIFYRAWKGKKRPAIPEFDIKFSEKWASGVSHKSLLTRLGAASNCLVVELSGNALVVRPMFPFNLAFLSQIYDLEHFIPKDKIKHIQPGSDDNKRSVVIEFEAEEGEKRIELLLRKRQEFLRAVGPLHAYHPVPSGSLT